MGQVVAFLREFRERRLFRIFVSYLATGYVALEVVDHFVDRAVVPELVYEIALLWYLGGIPASLIIGWFHGERGDQKAPKLEVFMLSVLGLVFLGLSGAAVSDYRAGKLAIAAAESGLNLRRVAVLYFRDLTRGGQLQYLADGLTEELIAELDRVQPLEVISTNGVAQVREADLPTDSIARLLEVGTVVDGTVERVGDRVRVNVRLVDASGAEFRRHGFERPAGEIFAMQEELAKETSRFLREWLGQEIRLRTRARETQSTAAWALFQRAEKARKDAELRLRQHDSRGMAALFQRADTLLAQAQLLDTAWVEPTVLRGFIAYRQSRLAHGPHDAVKWIGVGVRHVERALLRSPEHARALELRGTLRYWHHLLRVTPDPEEQAALLRAAREDLETAVRLDPSLASAHSTLSHLYAQGHDDIPSAVLAARKAYEEDAYLDVANEVLWRLTLGYYDMAEFTQARRWCDEGSRRFVADHRFAYCQLLLMSTPAGEPDVDRAWSLLARQDSLAPGPVRAYWRARGHMVVGGVIARAGLPDSARATLDRARALATHEADPTGDLLLVEAYMRTLLGSVDEAVALLKQYAAKHPHYSFEHHWRWQELRGDPRFRELRTAN